MEKYAPNATEVVISKTWSDESSERWYSAADSLRKKIQGSVDDPQHALYKGYTRYKEAWKNWLEPNIRLASFGMAQYCFEKNISTRTISFDHHATHAAYACATSPFEDALCMVSDGMGEGTALAFYAYKNDTLVEIETDKHNEAFEGFTSLGLFYSRIACQLCGFAVDAGEEWKVMGLAPYGELDDQLLAKLQEYYFVEGLHLKAGTNYVTLRKQILEHRKTQAQTYDDMRNVAYTCQHFFPPYRPRFYQTSRHFQTAGTSCSAAVAH